MRGMYTYSTKPYPAPPGVSALVADFGAASAMRSVDTQTAERLVELVLSNRLTPVSANGDLVLFLEAPDTLALLTAGPCGDPGSEPIVFDAQLAFFGGRLVDAAAHPGGTVRLQTCWRVAGTINRFFLIEWDLVDGAGHVLQTTTHSLGYTIYAPHTWPADYSVREDYRLILADDLPDGEYRVRMRVTWRGSRSEGVSAPDDASRYDAKAGVELGRVRVAGGMAGS